MSLKNIAPNIFKLRFIDASSFEIHREGCPFALKLCKAVYCFFRSRTVEKKDLEQHYASFGNKTILGRSIDRKKNRMINIASLKTTLIPKSGFFDPNIPVSEPIIGSQVDQNNNHHAAAKSKIVKDQLPNTESGILRDSLKNDLGNVRNSRNTSASGVVSLASATRNQPPLQNSNARVSPVSEISNHAGEIVSAGNIRGKITGQNIALTPDQMFSLGTVAADLTEIKSQKDHFTDKEDFQHWKKALKSEQLSFAEKIPERLAHYLANKFISENRRLDSINQKEFQQALFELVRDITERGLDINYSAIKDHTNEDIDRHFLVGNKHTISKLDGIDYYINIKPQVQCYDKVMRNYLQRNGSAACWDPETPFYRGGKAYGERKLQRNLLKGKPPFKNTRINRGLAAYGTGIYVSNKKEVADFYAKKNLNPTVVKINCRQNTPVLDARDFNALQSKVLDSMSEDDRKATQDLSFEEYYKIYFKLPVILQVDDKYFLFKNPSSIESVIVMPTDSENQPSYEISIHRLDKEKKIIGNPKSFLEACVPDDITLEQTVYKAHGYVNGSKPLELQVLKYEDKNRSTKYVARNPSNPKQYWIVRLDPESIKVVNKKIKIKDEKFILEPSAEFLKERYEGKRKGIEAKRIKQGKSLIEKTRKLFIKEFNEKA